MVRALHLPVRCDMRPINIRHCPSSAVAHYQLEFALKDFDHAIDAGLAERTQAPQKRSTDADGFCETFELWGPGCMISTEKGRVFLCATEETAHLEFVARGAPPHYMSGQAIRKGDRIRYAGEPGEVELVADPNVADETTAWHLEELGPGCMITTKKWGAMFLRHTEEEEDLELIARWPAD